MANRTCAVDGCDRTGELTRGWCASHYARWRKTGDVAAHIPLRKVKAAERCGVPDCGGGHIRSGWCSLHYQRLKNHGSLDLPAKPVRVCAVDGCENDWRSGDYCAIHWPRWRRYGDPLIQKRTRNNNPPETCTVDGCNAPHYAKGRCRPHDYRIRYAEQREKVNERNREHYRQNREQHFAKASRRRQRTQGGDLDATDRALSTAYRKLIANDRCTYCGDAASEVDHYFPLFKGGRDVWFNLVRACGPCNRAKAARCGTWFRLRQPRLVTV